MATDQDRAGKRLDTDQQSDEETMRLEEDLMRARETAGLTSPKYNMRVLEALLEVRYNYRLPASEMQVQQSEELLERHAAAPILNQTMSIKTAILTVGCEADYLVQALRKARFRLPILPPTLTSAMLALHNARVPDGGKAHLDKLYDQGLGDRERLLTPMENGIPRDFIKEFLHLIGPAYHPSQEQRVWQMREWHSETMRGPYRVDVIRPVAELKFEDAIESLQNRLQWQAREQYRKEHSLDERLEKYESEWNSWRKGLTDALHDLQRDLILQIRHRDSFIESSDGDETASPKPHVPEGIGQPTEASPCKIVQDSTQRLRGATAGASDLPPSQHGQLVMQLDGKINQDKECADNSPLLNIARLSDLSMSTELDYDEEDRAALEEVVQKSRKVLEQAAEYIRFLESCGIKPQELDFFDPQPIKELEAGIRLWDSYTVKVQRENVTHRSQTHRLQDVEDGLDCTTEQMVGRNMRSEAYLKTLAQELELENLPSACRRTVESSRGGSPQLIDRSNQDSDGLKTHGSQSADLQFDASSLKAKCNSTNVHDLEQRIQGLETHHSPNDSKSKAPQSAHGKPNTPVKAPALDNENQEAPAMTAEQKNSILREAQRKTDRTRVDNFLEELMLEINTPHEKNSRVADAGETPASASEAAKVKVYETPNRLIQEAVDDLYEASRVDEMAWKKQIRLKRAQGSRV